MNAHPTSTRPKNTPQKNPPLEVLRDGSLKATIWENAGENGPYFTTTFARTYQANDGSLKDSHSFSGSELLRVAELARQAYATVSAFRRDHAPEPEPQHEESLTDAYHNAL
jgi:hypothetical protein